jgi:uncharacterized protein (DUF2235 family)
MIEVPAMPKRAPKRLAIFLDGTWSTVVDNTNVWRLKSLCSSRSTDESPQLTYYGIGVHGLLGLAFGKGLDENITDAYEWLIEQYDPGDEIFIFGFCRGAYTARSLAGFIAKCGLLKVGAPLGVKQLYKRYRRAHERTIWELEEARNNGALIDSTVEEQWVMKYSMAVHIKVVGVWDTVGELGIPFFAFPASVAQQWDFCIRV